MMKQLFNIKIPSLLGILLLLIGVGVTSYLVDQGIIFEGRAAPEKAPANIALTNVSPTSFTVMYTTGEPLTGALAYGTTKEGNSPALDDRDQQSGRSGESTIHHITARNLTPGTTYYFSIISDGETFLNDGEPYEIKTPLEGSPPQSALPDITGSVTIPEGTEAKEFLVLFTSETLESRSAIVKPDSSYTIPLAGLRSKDLSSFATPTDTTIAQIQVLTHATSSNAKVLLKNTHPVPAILFGSTYDFTISNDPLSQSQLTASSSGQTFPEGRGETGDPVIKIESPEEAEEFSDQQPVFSGTGIPGEKVDIAIHSEEAILTTITVDSDGTWEFRPTKPLSPGQHTLTIKTRDFSGTLREFKRPFTVYAQGSQFVEPSVSPTRTPTPTLVIATQPPSVAPTVETPTITPVIDTPTPTTVAAQTTEITAGPSPTRMPPPVSGSREVIIGGILGAGTLVIGLLLFFLTRGSML